MRTDLACLVARRLVRFAPLVLGLLLLVSTAATAQTPLALEHFSQFAPQGFGSFHNSMARASAWWNGKLYVGTSRDHSCQQSAIIHLYNAFRPYPQPDPTISCTPDPYDLSLQAEIWRWTPDGGAGTWEMVYQSPNSLAIPGTSKFTAREVGFRDMVAFTEADGTPALYATAISARSFIAAVKGSDGIYVPTLPPPTLLRSTDGVNWAPVPQDPGTTLGDLYVVSGLTISSFSRITSFNNKLYLIIGGDFGHGILYEAANPEQGNNAFRRVSPEGMTFTYMEAFNGSLYLAQGAQPVTTNPPYKIVKMDTSTEPYSFRTIVDGTRMPAWLTADSPKSAATMHASGNALWVASNQPVELIRINPNDTWDLFIGDTRQATDGTWRYARTGLSDNFDWYFNIHIHHMETHDGFLYTTTADLSNGYPLNTLATFNTLFTSRYGFDVHRTGNGWYFAPITLMGFQEKEPGVMNSFYNFTGRVIESTPEGLLIGTGNNQFGLQMWRGVANVPVMPQPEALEAERTAAGVVLSWAPAPTATLYRIFKADYAYAWQLGVPFYAGGSNYPRPFREIGTVPAAAAALMTYLDTTPLGLFSQYYVVAENAQGVRSNPSNLARAPSLLPGMTFLSLTNEVNKWVANLEMAPALQTQVLAALNGAKAQTVANNYTGALTTLQTLYIGVGSAGPLLQPWRQDDAKVMVQKLMRRVALAQAGLVPAWTVKF